MVHPVKRKDVSSVWGALEEWGGAPEEQVVPLSLTRAEIYVSSSKTFEAALLASNTSGGELIIITFAFKRFWEGKFVNG